MVWEIQTLGAIPLRGPVERPEERTRRDRRIRRCQQTAANPLGHESPYRAFVSIAFGDDARAQRSGEGIDLEMRRRSFDVGDEREHVRNSEPAQPSGEWAAIAAGRGGGGEEPIEGAILTEVEQLFLA